MDRVCIYLRKSRQDEEVEHITGDTLANHRKELLRYSKLHGHNIIKIHEEVVSGDSIFHRPEMVEMLKEIEQHEYDAILVMDIDRLGRGDLQDQGMILNTLKRAGTIILTPDKVYDLENELDEQFTELKAFVSRQEYRMITKRLKAGQRRYVEEGNYIPPIPPYGYKIVRTDHDRTLEIYQEQAETVKLIFDMFLKGTGINQISRDLNAMGCKSYYGNQIERSWVAKTLRNPLYCGMIAWGQKEIKKSQDRAGKRQTKNRPKDKHLLAKGKHEAIIDKEIFDAVQKKLAEEHPAPVNRNLEIVNPLCGLIKCSKCGSAMRMHHFLTPYKIKQYHLHCGKFCEETASAPLKHIEKAVVEAIKNVVEEYGNNNFKYKKDSAVNVTNEYARKIAAAKKTIADLNKQKLKLHELVEKGIYDIPTFLDRSRTVAENLENTSKSLEVMEKEQNEKNAIIKKARNFEPMAKDLLLRYDDLTPGEKNEKLKEIIKIIRYSKRKGAKPADFILDIEFKF